MIDDPSREWQISTHPKYVLREDHPMPSVRAMASCEASSIIADILQHRSAIVDGHVVISKDAMHLLALRLERIAFLGLLPDAGDLGDGYGPRGTANPRSEPAP